MLMCCTGAIADMATDQVEFNFNFTTGEFPGSEVSEWFTTHTDVLTFDHTTGFIVNGFSQHVDMTFAIGNQVVTTAANMSYTWHSGVDLFDIAIFIPEAPLDYGPMTIVISGDYIYSTDSWEGTFTAAVGWDTGFTGTAFSGNWNAQVIPAPAGIALLGIAGLARRRRRN